MLTPGTFLAAVVNNPRFLSMYRFSVGVNYGQILPNGGLGWSKYSAKSAGPLYNEKKNCLYRPGWLVHLLIFCFFVVFFWNSLIRDQFQNSGRINIFGHKSYLGLVISFLGVFLFWNSLIRDPFQNSGLINFWSQISFYSLFIASRFNLNSIESLTRLTASQEKAANKTARVKGGQRVWDAISSTVGSRTFNIFYFIWTTRRVGGRRGHDRPSPCLAISTATLPVQQQPPSSR